MERWKKRAVDLLTSISFGSKDGTLSVVPYYPQKTDTALSEVPTLVRSTPEKHGISSKRLFSMLSELEAERRANVHGLMILKDGEVICECSREGFSVNEWHLSHSMSKTVTALAIGMLCDEGLIGTDMRVVDIFPEYKYKDKRFSQITIHHLLSMTSGVGFSEAGSVTESKWTEAFFSSALKFAPGTKFNYNSMNSYILAHIVVRTAKMSMTDFLRDRLFLPLGIHSYFWEKSAEGVEKGGWGLYLSCESWAKIGHMMLCGGAFFGRRILSEGWVRRSDMTHATAPEINGDFNYGYQLWVGRRSEESLFNGMFGQNVWICPRNNIVAVVMSGNNELFQDGPALEIIRKYLGGRINDQLNGRDIKLLHSKETSFFDSRAWVKRRERRRGFMYLLGLRNSRPFDDRWSGLLTSYVFAENHVGILPLIIRTMQNNLSSKIEKVAFDRYADSLYMIVRESGEDYRFEIGLYDYKEDILDFRGERYIIRTLGEAILTPDGKEEYRIEILFPELPSSRSIRIVKEGEGAVRMILSECPNNKIAENLLERITNMSSPINFGVDLLERRFGEGFINKKLESSFNPELVGVDTAVPGHEEILERENMRARAESRLVKLLRGVVDTFFKDDEDEQKKKEEKKKEGRAEKRARSRQASRKAQEKKISRH